VSLRGHGVNHTPTRIGYRPDRLLYQNWSDLRLRKHLIIEPTLARAYALQGDTAKARSAYQDFLALRKDADPDIPVLKQAKAEYAKLQ
jgi:hypothetical protein